MTLVRTDARGRVTIPAAMRRELGLRAGSPVAIERRGEEIVLRRADRAYFASFAGVVRGGKSLTSELLAERARDRVREERKIAQHSRGRRG